MHKMHIELHHHPKVYNILSINQYFCKANQWLVVSLQIFIYNGTIFSINTTHSRFTSPVPETHSYIVNTVIDECDCKAGDSKKYVHTCI